MSQDVLPTLLAEGVKLDGIFWDTYAEYYADMREFHEAVRGIEKDKCVEE